MTPSRIFILRPVATTLLMVAVLLVGWVAFLQLPVSALPEVDYPTIQVVTFYPGADPWIAKLDTVVHELYHIDPQLAGIRRIEREDGTYSANCHGHRFFEQVADMVHTYIDSRPSPGIYDFLHDDFGSLESRFGDIVGTTFRTFPSFPQRYIERLPEQLPCESDSDNVLVEPLRAPQHATLYTERDLHTRHFLKTTSRRLLRAAA